MVTIISTEDIDETKQWVFITIEHNNKVTEYTTVQPWNSNGSVLTGQDLQDWCDKNEDRFISEIQKGINNGIEHEHPKRLKIIEDINNASDINHIKNILLRIVKHIG